MLANIIRFSRQDLPLNFKMKNFWDKNGFLIIDNFYTNSNETINILEVGVYAGG